MHPITAGLQALGGMGLLVLVAFFAAVFAGSFALTILEFAAIDSTVSRMIVGEFAVNIVGFVGVALCYLGIRTRANSHADLLSSIHLRRPTWRDGLWILGGWLALFAIVFAHSIIIQLLETSSATSSGVESGRENPMRLLVGVPVALFFVGPGEEFLFRGVVQGRLREVWSTAGAIGLGAFLFALPHGFVAYVGDGALASLALIFLMGLALGAIYEHTRSLLVVAVIHGLFNATVYGLNYLTYG